MALVQELGVERRQKPYNSSCRGFLVCLAALVKLEAQGT